MNQADLDEAFLEAEHRAGLLDLEVGGVELWAALRHRIHRSLMAETSQRSGQPRKLRDRLRAQAASLPWRQPGRLWERVHLPDAPHADLLVVGHPRLLERNGDWVCRYSAPLLEDDPRSRVTLHGTDQGVRHPTRDRSVYWPELDIARAALRVSPRRARALLQRGMEAIREATAEIERAVGVKLPHGKLRRQAGLVFAIDLAYRPFVERLVDRVRPKAVVEVVHYGDLNYVLNAVCAGAGIPVLELQHGNLGPSHIAYRALDDTKRRLWPSQVLTWGDLWVDQTPNFIRPRTSTPAVGFALLEEARAAIERRPSEVPSALFLSQWQIGEQLSRLAVETARVLGAAGRVRYRLHPVERAGWRDRYPWLASSGVEVVDGAHAVYDDQAQATVQVGVFSTALVEGIAFQVPTLIAEIDGWREMAWLIDGGAARRVRSAEEIVTALEAPAPPDDTASGRVWAPEPRATFRRLLDEVLS